MSFTNYLENAMLNEVFGATNYTAGATLYVGLSTTAIADDGTGITEPAGAAAYARVAVTNNKTTGWSVSSAGQLANASPITFPQATADWGTVTHFFIADAASAGNILAYSNLGTSKTIAATDTASFAAGALTISLD